MQAPDLRVSLLAPSASAIPSNIPTVGTPWLSPTKCLTVGTLQHKSRQKRMTVKVQTALIGFPQSPFPLLSHRKGKEN